MSFATQSSTSVDWSADQLFSNMKYQFLWKNIRQLKK